jgi:hypothetical protein
MIHGGLCDTGDISRKGSQIGVAPFVVLAGPPVATCETSSHVYLHRKVSVFVADFVFSWELTLCLARRRHRCSSRIDQQADPCQ